LQKRGAPRDGRPATPADYVIVLAVKKLLVIFLLMVLPLQYSWAAAAVYCQHEKGESAHFGHHNHEHLTQADEPDAEPDAPNKSQKTDGDCEYCHLFFHASLLPAMPEVATLDGPAPPPPLRLTYSSHIPDGPNLPDWPLAA
jgi:hypothetical protein